MEPRQAYPLTRGSHILLRLNLTREFNMLAEMRVGWIERREQMGAPPNYEACMGNWQPDSCPDESIFTTTQA